MAFPTTTFTDPTAAISAMMNKATENGLDGAVADGFNATVAAVLANMMTTLPNGVTVGRTALATDAAAGITGGTGTLWRAGVTTEGGLIVTRIFVDLTGLSSSTTDLDIIGQGASPAHIGQITTAVNGTIIGGTVQCLEAPAGGVTTIDVYAATEATGAFDTGIGTLTETIVLTSSGAWTLGLTQGTVADGVPANSYLYLTGGAAGTAAAYTAGRLLITLIGI